MKQPSDFTDDELIWLAESEKYLVGIKPPDAIASKLVDAGLLDLTDDGLRITGLGKNVLGQARDIGRAPPRTTPRPG